MRVFITSASGVVAAVVVVVALADATAMLTLPPTATALRGVTFLEFDLLAVDGQRPSSTGVASGVRFLDNDGVLDRLTRGDVIERLMGNESGFGGRLSDVERVSEVVMMSPWPDDEASGFGLSRDLAARSRVNKLGATDFVGSVLDLVTETRLDDDFWLQFDSFERRGESFSETFFLRLRDVGPPATLDDSLPPSLAQPSTTSVLLSFSHVSEQQLIMLELHDTGPTFSSNPPVLLA